MNCLEARREILADPVSATRIAAGHLSQCPPCTEFAVRTARVDAQLVSALAIAIPPGLVEHILDTTVLQVQRRRRFLADPMALAGIDFVIEEEASAILAAGQPDPAALRHAVQALRIDLPKQLGELRYIGTCPFRGAIAHHLIATTSRGKVTLLLLPDRSLDEPKSAHARGAMSRSVLNEV